MLSIRLNTANKIIGGLLLVSLGILTTLLILTWRGSAVPEEKADQKIKVYNTTSIGSSMVIQEASYTTVITNNQGAGAATQARQVRQSAPILVHLYPYQWENQPIRLGAEIAAGVTVFLGLLYIGLKQLYRNVSTEIFP